MQRFDSLLLAAVGVLVLHQVAYMASALAGYEASVAHGHMAIAWFGGSLAVLITLARSIVRSLKRRNHEAASVWSLCGALIGGYTLMEQFERALDGYGTFTLFTEPVFWLGVAAAPIVALVLRWSVRSVDRLAQYLVAAPAPKTSCTAAPNVVPITAFVSPLSIQLASVVSRRGPPAGLHS